jgi:hypothetical protein
MDVRKINILSKQVLDSYAILQDLTRSPVMIQGYTLPDSELKTEILEIVSSHIKRCERQIQEELVLDL